MSNNAHDLADKYWLGLSQRDRDLYDLVRPLRKSRHTCDYRVADIERWLGRFEEDCVTTGGKFELCPDFQRGHCWSHEKQMAFVAAMLRGNAPMLVRFNNPSYGERREEQTQDIGYNDMCCIDGLQRLTALRDFVSGKFRVFGCTAQELDGTSFGLKRAHYTFKVEVHSFVNRKELLQFYLDLNDGGVVHSAEELARVRGLLAGTKGP
jgi:hypothetical protein